MRAHASDLVEADERKNEFLAVLGHELRNPLAAIDGGVTVLEDVLDDPEKRSWAIDLLRRNVGKLTSLLDDVLDITRISRGLIELRRERVSLREVVESAADSVRGQLEARGQELSLQLDDDVLVEGDPRRLDQVVGNLLSNAVKYTPKGGHLEVFLFREGEEALLLVKDDGVGIAAEDMESIFEPFRQLHSERYQHEGLGLGLALVRRITELHGGRVSVQSEGPERGSTFTVRLPVAAEQETAGTTAETREDEGQDPVDLTGRRVFVVEDQEDVAQGLAHVLERDGAIVETVRNGAEALARAPSFRPDAILVDIGLPDMTGLEVGRRLRAHEALGGATFVALSGFGHEQARRDARDAGFDHHVAKPARAAALARLIAGNASERDRS